MKNIYLLIAVLGFVLPYAQFVSWLAEHGLNLLLLWREVVGSRLSAFAWLDVVVSVLTIIAFAVWDSRQRGHGVPWWPILGCLTVGASFGLPLYLYLREGQAKR